MKKPHIRRPRALKVEEKIDPFLAFTGSLRASDARLPVSVTSATLEKHYTEGPLTERTDFRAHDVRGIHWLLFMGRELGIPELCEEAEDWQRVFISRDRLGRTEDVTALMSKIQREAELAASQAKLEQAQGGRERT